MNSMTGFGSSTIRHDQLEITIEITSINRRNLEINTSLPRDWQSLDRIFFDALRKNLKRGKINVFVKVNDNNAMDALSWHEPSILAVLEKLKNLALSQKIPFDINADLLFNIAKSIGKTNELPLPEDLLEPLQTALSSAINSLIDMRKQEGLALANDIKTRIDFLSKSLDSIKQFSKDVLPRYRKLLFQRLKTADINIDLDDERILKEIALFADKSDITEEITRLESHNQQFYQELSSEDSIGRKLDFLCQEMNREYNTIGSKANMIEVTKIIIDSKNELERIREQVQNIE